MMTEIQKKKLTLIINDALNTAETHWDKEGHQLAKNRELYESVSVEGHVLDSTEFSRIPGHEIVSTGETVVDEFVALVADMRDSSKHLLNAISQKTADVSELKRVYYETSALLPSLEYLVSIEEGGVTEYLGDGVLAFFRVDPDDRNKAIYAAHRAAKNAIGIGRNTVNQILKDRYRLPPIDLGVGLAISKTLITLTGISQDKHPKAFGRCVFKATKLSYGKNIIIVDEDLKSMWPASKGGKLGFRKTPVSGMDGHGYIIES